MKWVDVRKTTKISVKNSKRVSKKRSKSQYTYHQCSKTAKIKVYFQVISELLQRTQLAYRSMAIVMRCDFLFLSKIVYCGLRIVEVAVIFQQIIGYILLHVYILASQL